MSLREQLLANKGKTKTTTFFGQDVLIRELTAKQRETYELGIQNFMNDNQKKTAYLRARLVVYALCDTEGNQIFTDKDLDAVNDLPASEVDKLWDEIRELSGIGTDIEETEKN